jgi:hypothetical protein
MNFTLCLSSPPSLPKLMCPSKRWDYQPYRFVWSRRQAAEAEAAGSRAEKQAAYQAAVEKRRQADKVVKEVRTLRSCDPHMDS